MKKLHNIKLKTLLIFPTAFSKNQLIINQVFSPLGIAILAGYLNYLGYKNYKMIDLNCKLDFGFTHEEINNLSLTEVISYICKCKTKDIKERYKEIEKIFKIHKDTNLICFSVLYPRQFIQSLFLAKYFKNINKNSFIIFGGPMVGKHIKYLQENIRLSKMIDGIVVGDGEEPLAKLIYNLENNLSLKNVPNFLHKDGGSFKKTNNKFEITKKHLAIMPNFDGLELSCLPIRMSKGCYWNKCTFCNYRTRHLKHQTIEPKIIVKNIELLVSKYSINSFQFVDDAVPPYFLKEFSEILIKKK